MKNLLLILNLVMFICFGCATMRIDWTPIILTETANIPGTKNENYVKANLWLVDIFNSAKSVIQFSDKDAGVIKGKYVIHYEPASRYLPEMEWDARITITAIDNQLTITIVCNDKPAGIFGCSANDINASINGLIYKFKLQFESQ